MNATHDVFLLAGQSNMAGRGRLADVPPLRHDRVFMFRGGTWQPAREPLHTDKPEIAGAGLGMSFAVELAERNPDARIGLVPCAVGGTALSRWVPGADLYAIAVATTRRALSQQGVLRGILWHQGENDALNAQEAAAYGERLAAMVEVLRFDLGSPTAPFLAGELGPFLHGDVSCRHSERINAALRALATRLPHCACVSAEGLADSGDGVHFDAASLREFGRRYAAAYARLAGKPRT
jgi:hypothetical protein